MCIEEYFPNSFLIFDFRKERALPEQTLVLTMESVLNIAAKKDTIANALITTSENIVTTVSVLFRVMMQS